MPIKGSIYGATKWFAYGFGQTLAEEMSEWNGRCATIAPAMVNTPFFDKANQRNNVREIYLMPTNNGDW